MIRFIQKKHFMFSISIQDAWFIERLQGVPKDEKEVYEQYVIEDLMEERKATQRKWGTRILFHWMLRRIRLQVRRFISI